MEGEEEVSGSLTSGVFLDTGEEFELILLNLKAASLNL